MKKKIISLVLIFCLALSMVLTGCSGGAVSDFEPYDYDLSKYITLGNYEGLEYTPAASKTVIENGDTVDIDFVGRIDGQEFQGGSGNTELAIGSGSFIAGFEEGLVGHLVGETVVLNLTFPEDYGKEDLNGKPVQFTVDINKIVSDDPELTDKQNLWSAFMANCDILGYPEKELANTKQQQMDYYESYAAALGYDSLQAVLDMQGTTMEDFEASIDAWAKATVEQDMALFALARDLELTLSAKEYNAALKELIEGNGYKDQADFEEATGIKVTDEQVVTNIKINAYAEKCLEHIYEEAKAV